MRRLLFVIAIGAAHLVIASESMHVDGVLVYGRVRDVSVVDIREAIAESTDKESSLGRAKKPRALEIINSKEMRAYSQERDLGWIAVRRVNYAHAITPFPPDAPKWLPEGLVAYDANVLRAIRSSDEVYVFPVTTPLKPHRDDKRLRLLGRTAHRQILRLLSPRQNWYKGGYHLLVVEPEPTNMGLLFRRGQNELVLFFSASFTSSSAGFVEGTINGQRTKGMLEDRPGKRMEQWTRRYARSELAAK